MRLVTFLLLIHMGYIIAKAIENSRSCNHSSQNDPRLKKNDEIDIDSDLAATTGEDPDDVATRKTFSKPNNDNDYKKTNEFAANPNTLPQKLPLVNNVTKSPVHVGNGYTVTDKLTKTKDAQLQQPVYYQAIDPKYIIVSGLSLPKPNKNVTNVNKTEELVIITTPPGNLNLTKAHVSNRDEANDTSVGKGIAINDTDTDVSNIRELREHLLDHLLDYFLNIIKEENTIRNDTRKKNGKDRMKVEEKLRNYYDPHHLDMLFVDDDDYYDDNNLDPSDYHGNNDSEEDLLVNVKQDEKLINETMTNIDPLNTQADEIDKNTGEAHKSPEILQNLTLNLDDNQNSSTPDGESFHVNLSKPTPATLKYINLIEKENISNNLLNTTEKSNDSLDENDKVVTTTERSISNKDLNDAAEKDTDPLDYSDEEVTDQIEYIYDNVALTVDDDSYQDFSDSVEFEVVKNVTVHETRINDRNPIVITTENGRRKNGLGNEKYIANNTLNETKHNTNDYHIVSKDNTNSTSKDGVLAKEGSPNKLEILDRPNKNIDDDTPRTKKKLLENKNKHSSKFLKQSRSINKCALSIIFTKQIVAKTFDKTNNLEKIQEYAVDHTSAHKCCAKSNENDRNNTALMKKIHTHYNQRSDRNLESNYKVLSRHKHCLKNNIQKSDTEQKSDKNLKLNTKMPLNRNKLTSINNRNHVSNEETCSEDASIMDSNNRKLVEAIAEKIPIDKVKQEGETKIVPNDESPFRIVVDAKAHPSVKTVQRQKHMLTTFRHRNRKIRTTQALTVIPLITKVTHKGVTDDDVNKTKHHVCKNYTSFEETTRENGLYKLKHRDEFRTTSKYASKLKHLYNKGYTTNKTLPRKKNDLHKLKHFDNVEPVFSDQISKENTIYGLKHLDDVETLEEPISKQMDPENKPKSSHRFQKKRHRDKMVTKKNHIENAKKVSQRNDLVIQPRLPFYVSSTRPTIKELDKKNSKKTILPLDKIDPDILLGNLNTMLEGQIDLNDQNSDLNTTINRLTSSKLLDLITDKVAGQMLKKLQKSLTTNNNYRPTDVEPEKVEQIDILFKQDGDMVMMSHKNMKEKDGDENGVSEEFYLQ